MTNQELWQTILGELEVIVSKANFITWFQHTYIFERKKRDMIVAVPNTFTKEWLENKYNRLIMDSLQALYPEIRKIEYVIKPQPVPERREEIYNQQSSSNNSGSFAPNDDYAMGRGISSSDLNPKYQFGDFVIGVNNEMAYSAAKAVSEGLGSDPYNPLYIYGEVGLGKTHLLQSIGNKVTSEKKGTIKIKYATSEKFTNEFIEALRTKQINDFKNRYRDNDLLLIDDIQFIAPKEQTQGEFFHTFNTLYQNNRQVVLSADRPPKEIVSLEKRLQSRFEGGMMVDVTQPDIETRIAILKQRKDQEDTEIKDDVLEYIAKHVTHNIRELEGALNKIIAYTKLQEEALSLKEVARILKSLTGEPRKKATSGQRIIKCVSEFYEIPIKDIVSRGRRQEIVRPRQIAMFLMRQECNASYPSIGQQIGGRDHTTAIHSFKQVEEALRNDQALKEDIETIRKKIYD